MFCFLDHDLWWLLVAQWLHGQVSVPFSSGWLVWAALGFFGVCVLFERCETLGESERVLSFPIY